MPPPRLRDSLHVLRPLGELTQGPQGELTVTGVLGVRADGVVGSRTERIDINTTEAIELLHALRAAHDAVIVGASTCRVDDPRLDVRLVTGADPTPVVLDPRLTLDRRARLVSRRPTVFCGPDADVNARPDLDAVRVASTVEHRLDLGEVLHHLACRGHRKVLVEGGSTAIEGFAAANLLDTMIVLLTPVVREPSEHDVRFDLATSAVRRMRQQDAVIVGTDTVLVLRRARPVRAGGAAS